ncbi:MAG TPA: hypothetical protein VGG48_02345 [Rhizomicrobium sp.]|jgi:hypothetical protein
MTYKPVRSSIGAVCVATAILGVTVLFGGHIPAAPSGCGGETPDSSSQQDSDTGSVRPKPSCRPAADAYTNFVRSQFIDKGLLTVHEEADRDSDTPIVDLAPRIYGGGEPAALTFANQSFLMEDIRRGDPSIWTIENGRVVDISRFAHLTPTPFSSHGSWRGRLLFSWPLLGPADDVIAFQSVGAKSSSLYFVRNDGNLQTGDGNIGYLFLDAPGGDAYLKKAKILIFCRTGDKTPAATLWRVGDRVIFSPGTEPSCETKVGVTSFKEQNGDEDQLIPLGTGSQIDIYSTRDGRHFEFVPAPIDSGEKMLSSLTPSGERYRDPSAEQLAEAIERDYQNALPAAAPERLYDRDIRTSLDPVLQPAVQKKLDDFVNSFNAGGKPLIGAITVMDAKSGELLALASYPHKIEGVRAAFDADNAEARRVRQNQNFELLPVGSVAKPLIASAILTQYPRLASLTVDIADKTYRVSLTNLLGMPLTPPKTAEEHGGGRIDLDRFIEQSDNIYAGALLLLASADRGEQQQVAIPPGVITGYAIDGHALRTRPKSIFEAPDGHGGFVVAKPESQEQLAWPGKIELLFDVSASSRGHDHSLDFDQRCSGGGGIYGDDVVDASPWRALFEDDELNACGFREAAPSREGLAVREADDFRRKLLLIMLGNGEGRWSTVKVAEAYARIVTGRRVAASLVHGPQAEFAQMPAAYSSRIAITHALTLVTKGTEARTQLPGALTLLSARLQRVGLRAGMFSKTGTPDVPLVDYTPVDRAINALIRMGKLKYDERINRVYLDLGGDHIILNSGNRSRRKVAALLRADPASAEALQRERPEAVISAIQRDNEDMAAGRTPFKLERGRLLVRVAGRSELDDVDEDPDDSEGKVVAVVVGAYKPGTGKTPLSPVEDGSEMPVRAYSIVVNLQFYDKRSENAAADLAADIIKTLLQDRLAGGNQETSR